MKTTLLIAVLLCPGNVSAQTNERGFFVAYEALEMVMNNFRNFAGEVGYRFDNGKRIRLTINEVRLTERHLSSSWEAVAVSGPNVEGYFRGYEFNVDRFFYKGWYVSANVGYFEDSYRHTILDEGLENETFTVGTGIGFSTTSLFGIEHLYFNFANPVRFYFNSIPETMLGTTTIRPHLIVNNLWLFFGVNFATK